jgi:NTP pyrophosphatase (non-canonical NTP hydrolase)
MKLNDYQKAAFENALLKCRNLPYMIFGIANEAGEVAGKYKKFLRGDSEWPVTFESLEAELGDVLWYISGAAETMGISLETIAQKNLEKLRSRHERDMIKGDGDKR